MTQIDPTVGRVVHYYAGEEELPDFPAYPGEPLAAHVAAVHAPDCVNLMVIGASGRVKPRENVRLVQPGETPPDEGGYCRWMDYQVGQAVRTEQAEQQLSQGYQNV